MLWHASLCKLPPTVCRSGSRHVSVWQLSASVFCCKFSYIRGLQIKKCYMNLQISFYATFFLYIAIIVQWHTIHRCSGWCHRHHLAAVASSKLILMSGVATAAAMRNEYTIVFIAIVVFGKIMGDKGNSEICRLVSIKNLLSA